MSLIGLAGKCGVTTNTLVNLINGEVGVGVSGKLNTTSSSLQTFVNGGTSIGLAGEIGITSNTLQELRQSIGRDGAIGLLIGLMASRGS